MTKRSYPTQTLADTDAAEDVFSDGVLLRREGERSLLAVEWRESDERRLRACLHVRFRCRRYWRARATSGGSRSARGRSRHFATTTQTHQTLSSFAQG